MLDIHRGYLEPLGRYQNNPLEKGFLDPNDALPGNTVLYLLGTPQDTTGTIYDWSGQENDGAIVGATRKILPSGLPYLDLDGTDDYVLVSDNASISFGSGNFTLELWANIPVTASQMDLMSTYNGAAGAGYDFFQQTDGTLRLNIRETGGATIPPTTVVTIDDGVWHHLVGKRTGTTTGALRIDAVERATATQAGVDSVDNALDMYIGVTSSGLANDLLGGVALVRAHNTAVDDAVTDSHFYQERHLFGR